MRRLSRKPLLPSIHHLLYETCTAILPIALSGQDGHTLSIARGPQQRTMLNMHSETLECMQSEPCRYGQKLRKSDGTPSCQPCLKQFGESIVNHVNVIGIIGMLRLDYEFEPKELG